jgi:small subunit ribosomal protein S8
MTNVLINLINKIKIAHKNKEHSITVRSSLLCVRVLRVLQQEGVILSFTLLSTQHKQDINVKYVKVFLKYFNGRPLISNIDVVSLPSARKFYSVGDMYKYLFRNSLQGFYVMSTPNGITTSVEVLSLASKFSGTTGEVLLKVTF